MPFAKQRVRLAFEGTSPLSNLTDKFTSKSPLISRSKAVVFECAELYAGLVTAPSNIVTITLEVKPYATRTAAPILSKTLNAASLNLALTQSDWDNNVDQHMSFSFSDGDTAALDVTANPNDGVVFWLVVTATTSDVTAGRITLGFCPITAIEDGGMSSGSLPAAGDPGFYTKVESDGRYLGSTVKFINQPGESITLKNNDGWMIILQCEVGANPTLKVTPIQDI